MFIMSIVFGFLKKLNPLWFVIAILVGIAGTEYLVIKHDNSKIVSLETSSKLASDNIARLSNGIAVQNSAIQTASKDRDNLQVALNAVVKANYTDDKTVQTEIKYIYSKPVPVTCSGSMDELRSFAKQNALNWNNHENQ